MSSKAKILVAMSVVALVCVAAYADDYAAKFDTVKSDAAKTNSSNTDSGAPRYTFSWPLDANGLKPRGGSTKGAPLTLDKTPSAAWQALQAKNISDFERDRRAILAMTGSYRVTFDFLEVTPFANQTKLNAPYQSWGTEKVYVDSDTGKSISLVHMLEMRVVQQDGTISEPMVTKHWRQDWQYQPTYIVEYQGPERWQRRKLSATESKGRWLQTVYQVDESPRYASTGTWQHAASFSTWLSGDTWRPLPRREWSARSDYQVLIGTNRHTVTAIGWSQEENNLKTVLDVDGKTSTAQPYLVRDYLAREYGVARYERIKDADFAVADAYYAATKTFWDRVRAEWSSAFVKQGVVAIRGPVDKLGLFQPLFQRADEIAERNTPSTEADYAVITTALRDMGALSKGATK